MKQVYLSPEILLCELFEEDVLTSSNEQFTVDDFKDVWLENG